MHWLPGVTPVANGRLTDAQTLSSYTIDATGNNRVIKGGAWNFEQSINLSSDGCFILRPNDMTTVLQKLNSWKVGYGSKIPGYLNQTYIPKGIYVGGW